MPRITANSNKSATQSDPSTVMSPIFRSRRNATHTPSAITKSAVSSFTIKMSTTAETYCTQRYPSAA